MLLSRCFSLLIDVALRILFQYFWLKLFHFRTQDCGFVAVESVLWGGKEITGRKMRQMVFNINSQHAKISEVIPGLFVSGVCALTPTIIATNNIEMIINTTEEVGGKQILHFLFRYCFSLIGI